jgi:glycerophosphoryl diester phosphodiesterase
MADNSEREWVINSHRGAFKEGLLENSIESYTEAYREGCNVLETDIRLSKDNQIVLIHNRTIDGIAKHAKSVPSPEKFNEIPVGPVKEHTTAFLKALNFQNDMKILTLDEFIELLKKLKMGAQIELKEGGFEDLILKVIQDAQIDYEQQLGPIVCTSFNASAVLRLVKKAQNYQIPLYEYNTRKGLAFGMQGIPLGSWYGKWVLRQCGKKHIWGFMTYYKYIPIKRLAFAHDEGVRFCPRLPDDEQLVNAYIDAGVDGFETDNVPFIRKMIEKKGFKLWPLPQ